VASPDDALNTFFNSGIEYLALGDFLLTKTP
jgi:predicted NodU family carbamoyl transferase